MPQSKKKIFSKIYDQYIDKIYRFIFFKVGSREAAEDITSKIFVRGWDRFKKQDSNTGTKEVIKNPGAYIYQIARAELANYYREKSKFKIISTENTVVVDPRPDLAENEQLNSDIATLKSCLKQLDKDYQDIIILRYIDGYSSGEIAKLLGKSKGAVRVMLHRALKELRNRIREQNTP